MDLRNVGILPQHCTASQPGRPGLTPHRKKSNSLQNVSKHIEPGMSAKLSLSLLWEEHRLRVFENRMLRRIFGPKRQEDASWRK
jgi:hypothetical protein